jgi:hypothetical protein
MPRVVYDDDELGLNPGWDADPSTGVPLSDGVRNAIREAAVTRFENRQLRQQLEQVEKVQSFRDAGVPSGPIGDMFAKTYDGPTDAASVKAAWDSLGFAPAPPVADEDAGRRIAQAGATQPGVGTEGPSEDLLDAMARIHQEAWDAKGGKAANRALLDFINENGRFSESLRWNGENIIGIKEPDIE